MKSPIFLFSLPRAGSTLLQRVLMSHTEVASVAEPWIMLPFCYAYKREGTIAEYAHQVSYDAIEDFIDNLPNKETDYYDALRAFLNTLYEKQCTSDEKYFLDKTPRYYNIIPEIAKAFPDAKFIFLFRNPVHVMSSIIQTWGNGNLHRLYHYERDLNYGPKALSEGYKLLKDKAYAVTYEEYVLDPNKYTKEICDYLDVDFDSDILDGFINQDSKGRMGDPTGIKEYKMISSKSLDKWKSIFDTPFRKKLIYKYIESMDDETLNVHGYDKNAILQDIKNLKVTNKYFFKDRMSYMYTILLRYTRLDIFFWKRTHSWTKGRYLS